MSISNSALEPCEYGLIKVPKSTYIHKDSSVGIPWTPSENEAIVEDYLDMLQIELAGGSVVKAERNQKLQQRLGRSRTSIEYKHRNISAVLVDFGLPFIFGYKPASNYQSALCEAIKKFLHRNSLHLKLADIDTSIPIDISKAVKNLIYRPAPKSITAHQNDLVIRDILREFDPATRDAKLKSLGDAGENFVLLAEKNRLSEIGRIDLASKVRWIAKEVGDGEGFDILSFSEQGEERWLEVKTTNGPATTPFWITENERQISEKHKDKFRLTRLYHFTQKPEIFSLAPPLTDHIFLSPTHYRAMFRSFREPS